MNVQVLSVLIAAVVIPAALVRAEAAKPTSDEAFLTLQQYGSEACREKTTHESGKFKHVRHTIKETNRFTRSPTHIGLVNFTKDMLFNESNAEEKDISSTLKAWAAYKDIDPKVVVMGEYALIRCKNSACFETVYKNSWNFVNEDYKEKYGDGMRRETTLAVHLCSEEKALKVAIAIRDLILAEGGTFR